MEQGITPDSKTEGRFFNPKFRQDIVDEQRKRCIDNFHQTYAPHLLSYYSSKMLDIERYTPDVFTKIEALLGDEETTLYGRGVIDEELFRKYWRLIELSGHTLDEFGMIKEKINYEERLAEIEEKYSFYQWNVLFKLKTFLFKGGNNNIVVGGMGTGKSNLVLELALESVQTGNFELITNLGVREEWEGNSDIHHVTWMSELLRIVCKNKIRNIQLAKEGKNHLMKEMICVIDECENLFQSIRSGSKSICDFNKINNMARKLSQSWTFIFHRFRDVPTHIRNSPNLNCIIMKGCDLEGNPIDMDMDKAVFYFPKLQSQIKISGIPECKALDTDEYSAFQFEDENFPDKSVDINLVLLIASQEKSYNAPQAILNYLDGQRIDNIKREDMIKEVTRLEEIHREQMILCDNKTDYKILIEDAFSQEFGITDIEKIKTVKPIIKDIVNKSWAIQKISNNLQEIRDKNVNYLMADFDEIFEFLKINKNPFIKSMVRNNYRDFDKNEYEALLKNGIPKTKLRSLFGEIEEIITKKIKNQLMSEMVDEDEMEDLILAVSNN